MGKRKVTYCCERFEETVKEKRFVKASMKDETDWYMPEWLHIYFCPFCGKNVKGKGYGSFDVDSKKRN